jgi:hypothetical protein
MVKAVISALRSSSEDQRRILIRTGVPDSLTFAVVAEKLATVVGDVACFCAGAAPCCAYVVPTRNATDSPEMIKAEPRLRSIQLLTFIDSPKRHVFKRIFAAKYSIVRYASANGKERPRTV